MAQFVSNISSYIFFKMNLYQDSTKGPVGIRMIQVSLYWQKR